MTNIRSYVSIVLLSIVSQLSMCHRKMSADIIAVGASAKLVAKQFAFTEGPAADKEGNIFFTDQPNNKIWKYSNEGQLSVFMDDAGRSNGLYFDKDGNLISCADENRQLWSISPDKKVTVLVNNIEGKKLNGPNDVWIHPKGYIYFTDPFYRRNYWASKEKEITIEKVYFLERRNGKATPIIEDLKKPNGIIGTADGRFLYVADIEGNKTFRYRINADGTVQKGELFAELGSDGMTIDNKGNVYLTGKGVTVFNAAGQQIKHIPIPENWTANVTFGGKKMDKLFITASQAVYVLDMQVRGVATNH
jgi:gluconolactonase